MQAVAEGVRTARSARDLARRTGIEMPLVEAVAGLLFDSLDPRDAVETLMLREPKPEQWG
jgi:glycerol-3-phosphate dehydrogenase (NAD(P)+)